MVISMIKTSLLLTALTMTTVGAVISKKRIEKLEKRIKQLDADVEKLIQNNNEVLTISKNDDIIDRWR